MSMKPKRALCAFSNAALVAAASSAAAAAGVKLEVQQVTGANRIPFLLTDKVDIVISVMGLTPERAKQIMFTAPYADTQLAVFGPKALAVTSADTVGTHKIAVRLHPSVNVPVSLAVVAG